MVKQNYGPVEREFSAQWIWGESHEPNTWMLFRKKIELEKLPEEKAEAWIGVDSKYWLYLNGKLVVFEGGLKRGPNRKDIYADRVELTPYLKKGCNTISVLAVYYGVREGSCSYSHCSGLRAGFLFEAEIDGKTVCSDSSWKVMRHPGYIASVTEPNYRISESDLNYDAVKAQSVEGWMKEDYEDREWSFAKALGRPPAGPWNEIWERPIPLWKDSGIVIPGEEDIRREQVMEEDGSVSLRYTIKLPTNLQSTAYFRVKADRAGRRIRISTSANKLVHAGQAQYLTKEGDNKYESLLWLAGWEIMLDFPEGVTPLEVGYRATGYDTEFTGR